ncbi:MAG: sigma 54-interacting transcriptional regulator [Eubacteriales bacterium]
MLLLDKATMLLDCLSDMGYLIEIVDKRGYYVYCSKNCNYDTFSVREMIGKHATEAYNMTEESSVLLETLRSGKPHRNIFLNYISRKTGKEFFWVYDSFPIINKGLIEGAITIYRPLDDLKNIIYELNVLDSTRSKKTGNIHYPQKGFYTFNDIVCSSESMLQSINLAKRVAKGNSSVLLIGETGTGKELFAQSIHSYSYRKDEPFIAVNCAAIPDTLLESILFGVAKGAYTGAVERQGLFEESGNGTLFLDEIQSLKPDMQAKLLRVLEDKKIRRLGSSEQEITINPRIISAMNINPMQYIDQGKLKPDFFYRIAVVTIDIPPLRDRGEEILLLVNYFIHQINQKMDRSIEMCSENVIKDFQNYTWPGNVRELQHAIEHAANMMDDSETIIQTSHLPNYFNYNENTNSPDNKTTYAQPTNSSLGDDKILLPQAIAIPDDKPKNNQPKKYPIGDYKIIRQQAMDEFSDTFNRVFLTQALEAFHGNISKTARAINISRQHMHELIKKFDL